jgi:hypothetical protein
MYWPAGQALQPEEPGIGAYEPGKQLWQTPSLLAP